MLAEVVFHCNTSRTRRNFSQRVLCGKTSSRLVILLPSRHCKATGCMYGAPPSYAKSAASNSGRISMSESASIGFGQRLSHSTASSIDLTSHIQ